MTIEEYKNRMSEQEDWAPGWERIDEIFDELQPNQNPVHYATDIHKREIFGGEDYLDGYSIYQSPNDYKHVLTYGMTELYTNEDCLWAINILSNLAGYTYTRKKFFEPLQFVAGNGTSLHMGVQSAITELLIVNDTDASGVDTVHGRVEFMQLLGITQQELEMLKEDHTQASVLVEKMKANNQYLITDMKRTKSYIGMNLKLYSEEDENIIQLKSSIEDKVNR